MTSKLHLPGPGGKPLCGRQLNNHRAERVQRADRVRVAEATPEAPLERVFLAALLDGKACRHCGYASGLLVRVAERQETNEEEQE